jgi:hypothetical protein
MPYKTVVATGGSGLCPNLQVMDNDDAAGSPAAAVAAHAALTTGIHGLLNLVPCAAGHLDGVTGAPAWDVAVGHPGFADAVVDGGDGNYTIQLNPVPAFGIEDCNPCRRYRRSPQYQGR